jgi:WD40 repeat protein
VGLLYLNMFRLLACPAWALAGLSLLVAGCTTLPPSAQPRVIPMASAGFAQALAYSPDGRILLALRPPNEAVVYDAATLEVRRALKGSDEPVAAGFGAVTFSSDGSTVAIAGLDDRLTIWRATDWMEIQRFAEPKGVTGAALFPDGRRVAAVGPDNFPRIWDIDSRTEIAWLKGHTHPAISVALSPDARTLATGSIDRTVRLWDVEKREQIALLEGHIAPVLALAFSPDGATLASTAAGYDVRLWRLDGERPAPVALFDLQAELDRHRISQALLALAQLAAMVRNIQVTGGPGAADPFIDTGAIRQPAFNCPLAFSPDGKQLAIVHFRDEFNGSYHVEVYDAATRELVSKYDNAAHALAFSPDGKTLATSGILSLILIDPMTGKERQR